MDLKEIITSWVIKYNPTEAQQQLATERYSICEKCPSKSTLLLQKKWTEHCSECGCPLQGKIFTPKSNGCPLGKWQIVEEKYLPKVIKKEKTTI
jgi:hypothetical protein